jgi:hypothetical protein
LLRPLWPASGMRVARIAQRSAYSPRQWIATFSAIPGSAITRLIHLQTVNLFDHLSAEPRGSLDARLGL